MAAETSLTDYDIERIAEKLAPKLIDGVKSQHHDFWIDPEAHYNDHKRWQSLSIEEVHNLKDLVKLFVITRGLFWRAFIGAAIVGSLVMAFIGLGFKR